MASSAEIPPDTSHYLSCLQNATHLQCYQPPGPDSSRLVCSTGDGDWRAALLYTSLVALTCVLVPLAAVLNLAVVLTVLLNRKLHTVINVLVTVLGINNLAWTGLPILVIVQAKALTPVLCSIRAMLFIITRGVSFTVIVTITLLRYLIVVRNHSYPAGRRNVLMFVSIAVLPAVVKWMVRRSHEISGCNPVVARNPDGFLIVAKFEETFDMLTGIIAIVEYGGGLFILTFCYIRILIKTARSKQRVQGNENHCKERARRIAPATSQEDQIDSGGQKKKWAICIRSKCSRSDGSPPDSANSSPSRPGPSRLRRRTVSGRMSFVGRGTGPDGHNNQATFLSDRRYVRSDSGSSPPAVEEVTAHHQAFPNTVSEVQSTRSVRTTLSPSLATVKSLTAEACLDSMSQSRSRHQPPSFAAQEPQDSLDPGSNCMILQPSHLNIEPLQRSASCRFPTATRPLHKSFRRLRKPPGRVDIIATLSMTVFIVILFVVTFPYVLGVALINSRSVCVITAEGRILISIIVISSVGLGAVVSPIVLVLFSVDFRRAFWRWCGRAGRRFWPTRQ